MLRHFLVVVGTAPTGIRRPQAVKQRPSLQGTTMQLIIGNKNYSSWSMRSWVLLRHFGIPFTERKLHFDFNPGSAFYAELARITPAAKVPVLVEDDGFAVWDTLAIAEYIADVHPEHTIWPRDARPRACARSLCAEMHAGFTQLRSLCPMNIEAPLQHLGPKLFAREEGLRGDLGRVGALIEDALRASGDPFLFAAFGAVDAYYAPVAMRIGRRCRTLWPATWSVWPKRWACASGSSTRWPNTTSSPRTSPTDKRRPGTGLNQAADLKLGAMVAFNDRLARKLRRTRSRASPRRCGNLVEHMRSPQRSCGALSRCA